jgi:RHS repeat-associated protein
VTPANATFCYHYDGVGSTVAITDGSQNVVNAYAYSPDGMILGENEAFAQPFKYVGQLGVMAESNGLYYMRARYYNPAVGRFISEDPLGFGGGDVNLYVYAGNNPVVGVDPWGLFNIIDSTRNGLNSVGGEQMLGNLQKISIVAAVATSGSGVPSLVFGGIAVASGGLSTSLYSSQPYTETVQAAVTMPLGTRNPATELIVNEIINQVNELNGHQGCPN